MQQLMPPPDREPSELSFSAKHALELLQEDLSYHQLAEFAEMSGNGVNSYHLKYTPADVKKVRKKLKKQRKLSAKGRLGTPPVVPFYSSKGGTGKTVLVANIASALAQMGYRVLVIDGDAQMSLSSLLGFQPQIDEPIHSGSIASRFTYRRSELSSSEKRPPADDSVGLHPLYTNAELTLMRGSHNLWLYEDRFFMENNRLELFKEWLLAKKAWLNANFDIILVDTSPSPLILTQNFVSVADIVVSPLNPDLLSLVSLNLMKHLLDQLAYGGERPKHILLFNQFVASQVHPRAALTYYDLSAMTNKEVSETTSRMRTVIPQYVGFSRQMLGDNKPNLIVENPCKAHRAAINSICSATHELLEAIHAAIDEREGEDGAN